MEFYINSLAWLVGLSPRGKITINNDKMMTEFHHKVSYFT